ncbi:hypothetical protein F511_24025 [Dorcoceras hygrometricum]|uniref:Uncharacterized protein n=1 Tax=Dorcoceras hygrometricum TaxID=472368 RepID=A0A2Z7AQ74_9LAMI|nr:hypothetical protein F511_24025 [Dorcoceras hygrometricum]
MKIQRMRRGARYGMSCDDISLDVITISSWLSADEAKRKKSRVKIQQMKRDIQQENFALLFQQTKLQWNQSQRKDIQMQEDSGEVFDEPDASNSSIQSRAYLNQLLLINQSQALHPVDMDSQMQEKKK